MSRRPRCSQRELVARQSELERGKREAAEAAAALRNERELRQRDPFNAAVLDAYDRLGAGVEVAQAVAEMFVPWRPSGRPLVAPATKGELVPACMSLVLDALSTRIAAFNEQRARNADVDELADDLQAVLAHVRNGGV